MSDETGENTHEIPTRIEKIDIQNVMRFERFQATFSPSFSILIGDNGAGKTTLLTLLCRVLSTWIPQPKSLRHSVDFVRESLQIINDTPYRQPHHPWHLSVEGQGPDHTRFTHTESDEQTTTGNNRANKWHRAAESDIHVALPLLAYFSPWREPPAKRKPRIAPAGVPRRLDGYQGALDLHADFKDFAAWFKGFEMQRIEAGNRVGAVEAVRTTVMACIPGCTDLRWVPVLDDIVVTIHGTTHPIWRLSDGFRTMLALVGELAWRAAVLNPALGIEVAKCVEGVVLIDELDLHLHPRWQRRVVNDLRSAFPRVQFIATTHSPFIVQSMRADEVINLDGQAPMEYWREGIEDIATQGMGVTEGGPNLHSRRYRELEAAADQYYRLLEASDASPTELEQRRLRLDSIELEFSRDPAMAALLKMRRAATEERK